MADDLLDLLPDGPMQTSTDAVRTSLRGAYERGVKSVKRTHSEEDYELGRNEALRRLLERAESIREIEGADGGLVVEVIVHFDPDLYLEIVTQGDTVLMDGESE